MRGFLLHLILMITWVAVTGRFTPQNALAGFILGFVVIFFTRRFVGVPDYGRKFLQVIGLAAFFVWELIKANLRVALDIATPSHGIRPGVVAVPLDVQTDEEILLLTNLVTLTPGSVCLDISTDRRMLYLHVMYIKDPNTVRAEIKNGYERRVIEVLR